MKKGTARSLKNDKLSVLNCLENNIAFSHNQISGRFIDAKILGFKTQEQQWKWPTWTHNQDLQQDQTTENHGPHFETEKERN